MLYLYIKKCVNYQIIYMTQLRNLVSYAGYHPGLDSSEAFSLQKK
jgi:hypothetical protein